MSSRLPTLLALALSSALLAGCGTGGDADPIEETSAGDAHGARADAVELPEPPLALAMIEPSGGVTQLDLLDESVEDLGEIGRPSSMHSDGRYLFVGTDTGLDVVDSGRWTWDHVDHFHYYRAEPRSLGSVAGEGPVAVATTTQSTSGSTGVFFAGSGEAVLLDTEALSRGELIERFRTSGAPHPGMVVPVGPFALVTEAQDGEPDRVAAYTQTGSPTGVVEQCRSASGTITTRVGAVVGCADGALLASVTEGSLTIERIPYPDGSTAPAATRFANREGRPVVAALAGSEAVWLLDTRARSWTLLPAPAPLAAVTAVDDEADHVLALATDGRLFVLDGAGGGAVLAVTEPLTSGAAGGPPSALLADDRRAYLAAPDRSRVYEIDVADGARIARTFDTAAPPSFVAETGR
ncbi:MULTISPECIES: ABC transporter [unclassified Microbacterium]|uniref:ABC transporter n=1 Tax=unclassified Microbacterium TaxID=2609290 RepID=UPI003017DF32